MNALEIRLQQLVDSGHLKSFEIDPVDENGNIGKHSDNRNTEQMTLEFPDGEELVIGTFCSGCSEDTEFTAI